MSPDEIQIIEHNDDAKINENPALAPELEKSETVEAPHKTPEATPDENNKDVVKKRNLESEFEQKKKKKFDTESFRYMFNVHV